MRDTYAVYELLRYLDDRIDGQRARLGACAEAHRVLVKTELAEAEVIRAHFEMLLGAKPGSPRHIYTVMADYGVGEFLWYRRGIDPDGGVANMGSLMDSTETKGRVSDDLWAELRQWAEWYMDSTRNMDWARGKPAIDWDRFNAEGLRLARKLRAECSAEIKVEYCRAYDDPYNGPDRTTEIHLADSTSDKSHA